MLSLNVTGSTTLRSNPVDTTLQFYFYLNSRVHCGADLRDGQAL